MVLDTSAPSSKWLTAEQAAAHAQLSIKTVYRAVEASTLRAARVGGRRSLRFRAEWIDAWLEASAEPREVRQS
jgi:excisionase family DNA binding protein